MPRLKVTGYRTLYDQPQHPSSYAQAVYVNGRLVMTFIRASDGAKGLRGSIVHSDDLGKTWSQPVPFGPTIANPEGSNQTVHVSNVTADGKLLAAGYIIEKAVDEKNNYREGVKWRPNSVLIGLADPHTLDFQWKKYPQFTFAGESFLETGLTAKNGKLLLTCWGAVKQGDNWGAGLLISGDNAQTWKFHTSAYEPDKSVRKAADMPAGYNEQTLYELASGRIVSILRGRDKIGEIPGASPACSEALFSQAYTDDQGLSWSKPRLTNLPGTGAPHVGLVLPDGSLLQAARIPTVWTQDEGYWLRGLHLARSFDEGLTWQTERIVTKDPAGKTFQRYYDAMNGCFVPIAQNKWLYIFGHFNHTEDKHPTLALELTWE